MGGFLDIMVVESDPTLNKALCKDLEALHNGYVINILPVFTLSEAITLLATTRPHAILIDLATEHLEGIEAIQILRGYTQAPIVALAESMRGTGDTRQIPEIGCVIHTKGNGRVASLDAVVKAAKDYWTDNLSPDSVLDQLEHIYLGVCILNGSSYKW